MPPMIPLPEGPGLSKEFVRIANENFRRLKAVIDRAIANSTLLASVAGLPGLLADAQTPRPHATTHADDGADQVAVDGASTIIATQVFGGR